MKQVEELTPASAGWRLVSGTAQGAPDARAQSLVTGNEQRPYRVATWRGEPGRYPRKTGMPWSETDVVYKGAGRITSESGTIELGPGTIVSLPVGKPYTMEIFDTLEKMAIITEE